MSDFTISGTVGPVTQADGNGLNFRQDRQGGMVVADGQPRYSEAAGRGFMFSASVGSAGVAPGTVIGTAAAYALYNPSGSGVRLAITRVRYVFISGTLGQGVMYHTQLVGQTAAPSGTGLNIANNNFVSAIGGAGNKGLAFSGATLASTPTIIGGSISLPPLTNAITYALLPPVDEVAGAFSVGPGGIYALEAVAGAGTTPLIGISVEWQEIPQ